MPVYSQIQSPPCHLLAPAVLAFYASAEKKPWLYRRSYFAPGAGLWTISRGVCISGTFWQRTPASWILATLSGLKNRVLSPAKMSWSFIAMVE